MTERENLPQWSGPRETSSVRKRKRRGLPFNHRNALGVLKGVRDWWSDRTYSLLSGGPSGGGLGYWLAVPRTVMDEILRNCPDDVEKQKEELIKCWMATDCFPSWHRLSCAVEHLGDAQLAAEIRAVSEPLEDVPFTCSNVLRALEGLENWWGDDGMCRQLSVSESKKVEIRRKFPNLEQQRRQVVLYWMLTDPFASWRRLITRLDEIGQTPMADRVRDFAEPLTDATLNPQNVLKALSTLKDWKYVWAWLDVSASVWNQIQRSCPTTEEQKETLVLYYLHTLPHAAWKRIASLLYCTEKHTTLQAVRKYLCHETDPTLTAVNLSQALEGVEAGDWNGFGEFIGMSLSKRLEIRSEYATIEERKSALIRAYLDSHPAPTWEHVADALYWYSGGKYQNVLQKLQKKFPTGRYRAKLIYEQEMKRGHSTTEITKVVMFGIAGSGKTTSLETIMEEEPPAEEDRESTPLMKSPVKTMMIVVDNKMRWKKCSQKDIKEHIATCIRERTGDLHGEPEEPVPSSSVSNPDSPPFQPDTQTAEPTLTTPKAKRQRLSTAPTITTNTTVPMDTTSQELGTDTKPPATVESLLQSSEVEQELFSLSNNLNTSKSLFQERWVYLVDTGGQPQYHEALSVFLKSTSACIFVSRLSEALDSYPSIEYYSRGKRMCKPHPSALTNKDIFKQCMRTMHSFSSQMTGDPPKILLLGTHRDKVHECEEETVAQKNEELEEIIPPLIKKQLIYCDKKKLIFEINALKPDSSDKLTAEKMRRYIMEQCPSRKVEIPLRGHTFDQKLREIAEGLDRKVLSLEESWLVAQSLGLDEESFDKALDYFHDLTVIFYFRTILPNVVFVEPQVLLDKVTELVVFSFMLQHPAEDDHPHSTEPAPLLPPGWKQFDEFGQVTQEFLNDKQFHAHYHSPTFTSKELILLLEELLVLAKLSADVGPDTWFMPSVLKQLAPEEVRKYCVSPFPLVVYFPDGGPQNGVYCSLISYVLSPANQYPCAWNIQLSSNHPACLYRNCIQFHIPKFPGSVTLIDRHKYFEVHLNTSDRKLIELWQHIRHAIFNGMDSVSVTLCYSSNRPSPAILCPAHPTTPHPAPVDDGLWICSSDSNFFGDIHVPDIPWLECVTSNPTTSNSSCTRSTNSWTLNFAPTLHDLMNTIAAEAPSKWNEVALGLGLEARDVNRILEENPSNNCMKLYIAVFDTWKRQQSSPYTWQTIVDCLESPLVKEKRIAQQIRSNMCQCT